MQSYRNRYFVVPKGDTFDDWLSMTRAGWARGCIEAGQRMVEFTLTRAGAEMALQPGETLCPEDFPV